MADNILKRALHAFAPKSINFVNPQNHGGSGWKFIDAFFNYYLGKGGSFLKYTKAYGENPLVYMVVKKIAISSASMKRIALDENGEQIENSVLLNLLSEPNMVDDEIEFREKINEYLLLTGNSYVRIVRGEGGLGTELQILETPRTEIVLNSIGEVEKYQYTRNNGTIAEYMPEEVLHIKTSNVVNIDQNNFCYGLSPLQAAWILVASSMEKLKADASIFKSRGIIGILTSDTDTPMLDPERERLQKEFDEETSGAERYNKIRLSSSRLRYLQTGMSPTDLKLLEGILSSLRLICGVYGMPSVLFNDNETSTYNNVETAKRTAYLDVYIPLANKVDKELSKWLSDLLGVEEKVVVDLTSIEEIKASTNELAMALHSVPVNVLPRVIENLTQDEIRSVVNLDATTEEVLGQANSNINISNGANQAN